MRATEELDDVVQEVADVVALRSKVLHQLFESERRRGRVSTLDPEQVQLHGHLHGFVRVTDELRATRPTRDHVHALHAPTTSTVSSLHRLSSH